MTGRPDIMGRLQTYADERFFARPLILDAMAEIERLRSERAALREALREMEGLVSAELIQGYQPNPLTPRQKIDMANRARALLSMPEDRT